jgi:hypothetical protein
MSALQVVQEEEEVVRILMWQYCELEQLAQLYHPLSYKQWGGHRALFLFEKWQSFLQAMLNYMLSVFCYL